MTTLITREGTAGRRASAVLLEQPVYRYLDGREHPDHPALGLPSIVYQLENALE